ncbi:leucine-rich repeat extensin-like protein 3 [Iris pallida]|uniref:Leucine-rich repeat extensin-like protein 3 n=1 Tax=Iris pallida TaxID=29817 RepID=A0AAX6FZP8_IRIPA|nr:leucine-rich repeat extensin-like protein 3 [Iris pallida]
MVEPLRQRPSSTPYPLRPGNPCAPCALAGLLHRRPPVVDPKIQTPLSTCLRRSGHPTFPRLPSTSIAYLELPLPATLVTPVP